MSVEPIPFEEGRFLVTSDNGKEPYVVDLRYREEPWNKPRPLCGCPQHFAKGILCKHVEAVVRHEMERLKLI